MHTITLVTGKMNCDASTRLPLDAQNSLFQFTSNFRLIEKEKAARVTSNGVYERDDMPLGLQCSAPSTLKRLAELRLKTLEEKSV